MNEEKLWLRRYKNSKCAGCGCSMEKAFMVMCTACDNTHPKRDRIREVVG